jgi:hypothetical protein
MLLDTALLPMLALTLVRNFRPVAAQQKQQQQQANSTHMQHTPHTPGKGVSTILVTLLNNLRSGFACTGLPAKHAACTVQPQQGRNRTGSRLM